MSARRLLAAAAIAALAGCASPGGYPPLATVEAVDLQRYAGRWYEIAGIPNRFQRDCVATRATYAPREDGRIDVLNECRDGSLDGPWRRIEGVAYPAEPGATSRLKVRFFWPFAGDYWVMALDPEYRYALVGHPSRDYLWVLSRTPALDEAVYRRLLAVAAAQGYDLERIRATPQNPQ
jgi:apolipoprotein D and lipocalin family protein